jgi:hypothetical protein
MSKTTTPLRTNFFPLIDFFLLEFELEQRLPPREMPDFLSGGMISKFPVTAGFRWMKKSLFRTAK